MNLAVFNASMFIGWLMVSTGACLASLPYGLVASGLLLLVLTVLGVRTAGIAVQRERNE